MFAGLARSGLGVIVLGLAVKTAAMGADGGQGQRESPMWAHRKKGRDPGQPCRVFSCQIYLVPQETSRANLCTRERAAHVRERERDLHDRLSTLARRGIGPDDCDSSFSIESM